MLRLPRVRDHSVNAVSLKTAQTWRSAASSAASLPHECLPHRHASSRGQEWSPFEIRRILEGSWQHSREATWSSCSASSPRRKASAAISPSRPTCSSSSDTSSRPTGSPIPSSIACAGGASCLSAGPTMKTTMSSSTTRRSGGWSLEEHPLCLRQQEGHFGAVKLSDFLTQRELHRTWVYDTWFARLRRRVRARRCRFPRRSGTRRRFSSIAAAAAVTSPSATGSSSICCSRIWRGSGSRPGRVGC